MYVGTRKTPRSSFMQGMGTMSPIYVIGETPPIIGPTPMPPTPVIVTPVDEVPRITTTTASGATHIYPLSRWGALAAGVAIGYLLFGRRKES